MPYIGNNPTDVPLTSSQIADSIITLAKMSTGTDGNIISYDASGNPVAIATGSDGQVLTSAGAGAPPAFEAIPSGGKVLQVVSTNKTDAFTTTSSSFVDITGYNVSITPASASSKVLISGGFYAGNSTANNVRFKFFRDGTEIASGTGATGVRINGLACSYHTNAQNYNYIGINFLDSPSSTSAVVYKVQASAISTTFVLGHSYADSADAANVYAASTLTAMEIGA